MKAILQQERLSGCEYSGLLKKKCRGCGRLCEIKRIHVIIKVETNLQSQ